MRDGLKALENKRTHFKGTFLRFGTKSGWNHPVQTILLKDIFLADSAGNEIKQVSDHLWFTLGKRFEALKLVEGDKVLFDGRVSEYFKGYRGYRDDVYDSPMERDFKISYPTNLRKQEAV